MSVNAPRLSRVSSSASSVAAGTDITLQVGADPGSGLGAHEYVIKVIIKRVKLRRTSGTAANFTPRIFSASGATAGDITQEYEGAATAVGTLFDATPSAGAPCYTDNRGRLFLRPTPDAGADNAFNYAVYYEIAE